MRVLIVVFCFAFMGSGAWDSFSRFCSFAVLVLRFKASGVFRGISIQRERMALHDFRCAIRFVIWSSTMPTGLLAGVHNVQFPHKGSIGDNRKVLLSIFCNA